MDRASNMDVVEDKCTKRFFGEYHFEDLGTHKWTTLKFIFQIR